ncbi:MAG TPA: glycosyltransferase family 2 protein [Candidatus Deferrimicrobiaceae bacterium]|jgi:glycosyltransferase involved in cell wall biosynthesis
MTVTLLILSLNEIEGLKALSPLIRREWVDQILLVDGQSTDGSAEYAREIGYEVYVQKKRGLRAAYQEAWPLIRGDYVITFSPDGNSPPEYIPQLVDKAREGYDMVIGSRYFGDATSEDDDLVTGFGNWLFTRAINLLHGGHYTDAMTIYRIYRTSLFRTLRLDEDATYEPYEKAFFTRIGVEPILSVRAAKARLKIADIACPEPKRIGGERKLQVVRWGLAYMSQVILEKFTHI